MKTSTLTNNRTLKGPCIDFMFAYSDHDMAKMMSMCNEAGEVHFHSLGEQGRGTIGELGKAIWSSLIECFPDIENTVNAATTEGDNIRCQVLISGTQAKDFADIPSKGLRFESDHVFVFHLNDKDKIDRIHIKWDHADLKRQLGAA